MYYVFIYVCVCTLTFSRIHSDNYLLIIYMFRQTIAADSGDNTL